MLIRDLLELYYISTWGEAEPRSNLCRCAAIQAAAEV